MCENVSTSLYCRSNYFHILTDIKIKLYDEAETVEWCNSTVKDDKVKAKQGILQLIADSSSFYRILLSGKISFHWKEHIQ